MGQILRILADSTLSTSVEGTRVAECLSFMCKVFLAGFSKEHGVLFSGSNLNIC